MFPQWYDKTLTTVDDSRIQVGIAISYHSPRSHPLVSWTSFLNLRKSLLNGARTEQMGPNGYAFCQDSQLFGRQG